jgi:uncharacterized delta-60 repeat protein
MTIAGSVLAQFGPTGVLQTAVTGGTIVAASAGGTNVFQPDGRYLLVQGATDVFDSVDRDIQVIRSPATGGVDWAFNNPSFDLGAAAVVVQPDGKILVAGTSPTAGSLGLGRLNSDGSLDASFGSGGTVSTGISGEQVSGTAMVLQPDGKIVVIGQALINSTGAVNLVVARYLGH